VDVLTVTIAGAQPDAPRFYKLAPEEPIRPTGTITTGTIIPAVPTLIALLDLLIEHKPDNLLLIAHGEGTGLDIPLIGRSKEQFVSPNVDPLVESIHSSPSKDMAKKLGMTAAELTALIKRADSTRQLNLKRLEIRACNLGQFPKELDKLRRFFGAVSATAPTTFDVFGHVDPGSFVSVEEAWNRWREAHPAGVVEGEKGRRVGFEFYANDAAMQVESAAGVKGWVSTHFGKNTYASGAVAFHGLLKGAGPLVFPRDNAYRGLLHKEPPDRN
jgi:hypothetical protein